MIGYRVSRTGRARRPLFVPEIARNLWSVEEFCWLIVNYPALIDESLVDLRVTRWLASEFGIAETALRMERGLRSEESAIAFFTPLLTDLDYLPQQELHLFTAALQKLLGAPMAVRYREKGDALFENRRFGRAITCYRQSLEIAAAQGIRFTASLHARLGAAQMQLLKYEEGFAEFSRAYALTGSEEDLKRCLLAKKLMASEEEYQHYAEQTGADAELLVEIEREADRARTGGAEAKNVYERQNTLQPENEHSSGEEVSCAEGGSPAAELAERLRALENAYHREAEG